MMTKQSPEIIEVNSQKIEELLDRAASNTFRNEDTELMRQFFESYAGFFQMVGDKNTTIARLRKIMFGSTSEKSKVVLGDDKDPSSSPPGDDATDNPTDTVETDEEDSESPSGHGKHGADDYPGAEQVQINHPTLAAGDDCPACGQGTLYEKSPGVLVRFIGQAPLQATVYRMQKLRCHVCGKTFTAPAPEGVGDQKYDATAASMIGLLKYGSGLPFNRLERLGWNLGIPLPASTQWDVLQPLIRPAAIAFEQLIREAAQGEVLHNDDTTVKILELMGQRAREAKHGDQSPRTGMFTSGVVSVRESRRIALFFSGRQHAGENLSDVLKVRLDELLPPIQMCDGLSRNLPKELETIVANCLVHARRNFVEIYDRFPDECRTVIETLKVVYRNDAQAQKRKLSPVQRLKHHRVKSEHVMNRLHRWLNSQLDNHHVEPNSALGVAINYMLKRWDTLTLFLREPGAPLDNNICERALKKSILHRKNSLFYKTEHGARVGDTFMSLIYTCELCGTNPFEYLTALQHHANQVNQTPQHWMPWNYADSITAGKAAA